MLALVGKKVLVLVVLVVKIDLHSNSSLEEKFWYKMELFQEIEHPY